MKAVTALSPREIEYALEYYAHSENLKLTHKQYSEHESLTKYGTSAYIKNKQPMPVTYECANTYFNQNNIKVYAYKPIRIAPIRRMVLELRGEILPIEDTMVISVEKYLGKSITIE